MRKRGRWKKEFGKVSSFGFVFKTSLILIWGVLWAHLPVNGRWTSSRIKEFFPRGLLVESFMLVLRFIFAYMVKRMRNHFLLIFPVLLKKDKYRKSTNNHHMV